MQIQPSYISCGISQLYGLQGTPADWKERLRALAPQGFAGCQCAVCRGSTRMSKALLVFSDNTNSGPNGGYGENFAKWLKENNMGDVVEVSSAVNPNTGNRIKLWSWSLPNSNREFMALLEAAKV